MSCMWVSVADCNQSQIFHLTQLLREDKDLQIVLSYDMPMAGGRGELSSEKRIERLLSRQGIPTHLKGYCYLKTALAACLKDIEELDGITKRLYPTVAKKHQTSVEKVEHAIRHAIEAAWKKADECEQVRLFGYGRADNKRPTNLEFISKSVEYLRSDLPLFYS